MPSQPLNFGLAALLATALLSGQAFAQTAAPAAQPAPAGQAPQGQQQNPNAPVKIDMQTVPKTEWTKVCSKPQAGQKDLCFTTETSRPLLMHLRLSRSRSTTSREMIRG